MTVTKLDYFDDLIAYQPTTGKKTHHKKQLQSNLTQPPLSFVELPSNSVQRNLSVVSQGINVQLQGKNGINATLHFHLQDMPLLVDLLTNVLKG